MMRRVLAIRNTNDGISIIQIAEGALDEVTTILQRVRDLAVQAANDSLSADERTYLKNEANALIDSFEDVTAAAKWNGSSVFTATDFVFQTGADNTDTTTINIGLGTPGHFLDATGANASLANAKTDVTIDSNTNANASLVKIDAAITDVASTRAQLGAYQAQLESTVRNLANVAENTAAAAGRIMDTDYAAETANLTKAQILQQAATSILAQANAQPQSVLSLLQ